MVKLVLPTIDMEKGAVAFKQEFFDAGERVIDGSFKLDMDKYTYAEWVDMVQHTSDPKFAHPKFGSIETYFALDEAGEIVGVINFRHSLEPFYLNSGHIGYSVRPSRRREGFATEMLKQILTNARKAGLDEVKLVCKEDNIPSLKTIVNNGGTLFRTFEDGDTRHNEYIIIL